MLLFLFVCFRYLADLDPYTNVRNPWYQLTLEETYQCTFNSSVTDRKPCHGNETFEFLLDTRSEGSRSSFMIDAVYALAHALNDMLNNCHGNFTSILISKFKWLKLKGASRVSFFNPYNTKRKHPVLLCDNHFKQWQHQNFFFGGGGLWGGKMHFRGGKNPKFAENGWLLSFFLLMGGGNAPHAHAPPWCCHLFQQCL